MHTLHLPPSRELFEILMLYVFVIPIVVISIIAAVLWAIGLFQVAV